MKSWGKVTRVVVEPKTITIHLTNECVQVEIIPPGARFVVTSLDSLVGCTLEGFHSEGPSDGRDETGVWYTDFRGFVLTSEVGAVPCPVRCDGYYSPVWKVTTSTSQSYLPTALDEYTHFGPVKEVVPGDGRVTLKTDAGNLVISFIGTWEGNHDLRYFPCEDLLGVTIKEVSEGFRGHQSSMVSWIIHDTAGNDHEFIYCPVPFRKIKITAE